MNVTLVPLTFKRRGVRRLADTDEPRYDAPFLIALGRAFHWQQLLDEGVVNSGADIARREGLDGDTVNRIMRLAWLAPDLIERLLTGSQPKTLSLAAFQRHRLPADWEKQRARFDRFE
ncbi:Site-specific recombinase resolvase [Gammaproteobacteria bacterium]